MSSTTIDMNNVTCDPVTGICQRLPSSTCQLEPKPEMSSCSMFEPLMPTPYGELNKTESNRRLPLAKGMTIEFNDSNPDTDLKVKRLNNNATVPTRGSVDAAGYDLYASENITIPGAKCTVTVSGSGFTKKGPVQLHQELVKTDIAIKVPDGHYGRIAPRSGFSWKQFTDIGAGVIDVDYRGEVKVLVRNLGNQDLEIKKGDRIAQLILERNSIPNVVEVDDLDATDRGAGGFGSTGTN